MASAQVLRKQGHLEAGKRKLEEFRRKKAAEKAKKALSTNQFQASDSVPLGGKLPQKTAQLRLSDSDGVGTSDGLVESHLDPSGVVAKKEPKDSDISHKIDISSSNNANAKPSFFLSNNEVNSSFLEHSHISYEEYKHDAAYEISDEPTSGYGNSQNRKDHDGLFARIASNIGVDNSLAHHVSSFQKIDSASSQSSYHGLDDYPSKKGDGFEQDLSLGNSGTSAILAANIFPKDYVLTQDELGYNGFEGNSLTSTPYQESVRSASSIPNHEFGAGQDLSLFSDIGEKKFRGSIADMRRANQSSPWNYDNRYPDHDSDAQISSTQVPSSPPAGGRRSRPSFLDSIQISRGPLSSQPVFGSSLADSSSSSVYQVDSLVPSISQSHANSSIASGDGVVLLNHVTESTHEPFSQNQNEDFAALEQHIEDLMQEKFSLQRALDASRALAESLASENSALTESFNQQGSIVNQLKFDLEKLQEEIKVHLVELEAVKIEYANAQLECNAADERAKLLASEVIELEEKALRLRSNELKLERQLENSQAEVSSYRKKMSSLEKDRQDLQSSIDALQEEKKLLQSKLQKASANGTSFDVSKSSSTKKDVSTSSEDLDINTTTEPSDSETFGDDAPSSQFPHENILLSIEGLPLTIPSDQIGMIQNINTLTAELALEKDQLVEALSAQSSESSKLLELNKELTRKLEAQTQRLELLTAQSMPSDNFPPGQLHTHTVNENTPYADEGDEVVERVLGWIMKLFPGGPSRRRTSKHL